MEELPIINKATEKGSRGRSPPLFHSLPLSLVSPQLTLPVAGEIIEYLNLKGKHILLN